MFDDLKKVFEQQRQQPGTQPMTRDYSGEFQKLSDEVETLGGKLDRLISILEEKPPRFEAVTLDTNARTFDNLGYKYFGLFVTSNTTITISFQGITATVNLVPGYNAVDMFQGSTYTASSSTQAGLIWSDVLR